jgi:hypothetical protein
MRLSKSQSRCPPALISWHGFPKSQGFTVCNCSRARPTNATFGAKCHSLQPGAQDKSVHGAITQMHN